MKRVESSMAELKAQNKTLKKEAMEESHGLM
jgi:hypothetical protein